MKKLLDLGYRWAVPAFLGTLVLWVALNQLRVLLYDGDHGPSDALELVLVSQNVCVWAAGFLLPFACLAGGTFVLRWLRSK